MNQIQPVIARSESDEAIQGQQLWLLDCFGRKSGLAMTTDRRLHRRGPR